MHSEDYIRQDGRYMRPEELKYLKGDCSKIKRIFGWNSEYSFEMIMDDMINFWEKELK